jgi:PKHD-type hydroxylase
VSNYQFAPSPDLSTKEQNHAFWENGFTPEDVDLIREAGDRLPMVDAAVGADNKAEVQAQIRKSRVGWLQYSTCPMVYDKLAFIARQLNGQYFNFDLYGFVEDMQYTVYGPDREHYDWHMDKASSVHPPRKLSMVLQLSDPSEYDGGDLELMTATTVHTAKKEKGLVYVFPSYVLHRVTPVTRGTRRTIVVWVAGPSFR